MIQSIWDSTILKKRDSSLILDIEFNDFADGMELSIYYLEKGNVDNRKNFVINVDRFQSNKILTKSIKILKMKDPEYPDVSSVHAMNDQSNVLNSSIFRILVLFCIILPILHIVIIVLYYLRIKINAYENKITERNEANNKIKLKVVNAVASDNIITNHS